MSPGQAVLVELRATLAAATSTARRVADAVAAVQLDEAYEPVPMQGGAVIVRCTVGGPAAIDALKRHPDVIDVWNDTPIAPMSSR